MTVILDKSTVRQVKPERINRLKSEIKKLCDGTWTPEKQVDIDYYQTRLYALRFGELSTINAVKIISELREFLEKEGFKVGQIRYGKLHPMDMNLPNNEQKALKPKTFKSGSVEIAYNRNGNRYVFGDISKVKIWSKSKWGSN